MLKQVSWMDGVADVGHWRTHDGDDVDVVVERDDGSVVAVEVKAPQRITASALTPLRKLRGAVGRRSSPVWRCTSELAPTPPKFDST